MKAMIRLEGMDNLKKELDRLGKSIDRSLEAAAKAGAAVIEEFADQEAPGGGNRHAVTKLTDQRVEVEVGPDKDHWYYQFAETGTDAHEITPDMRQALAFPMGGEMIIIKRAEIPGRAAKPFLRPAIDNHQKEIISAIIKRLQQDLDLK